MKGTTDSSVKPTAITHKLRKVKRCPKLIKPIIILLELFRGAGSTAVIWIFGIASKEADDAFEAEKIVELI